MVPSWSTPCPSCEFELGHPGPHHSLGQAHDDGYLDLWIQWSDYTASSIVGLPPCEAENEGNGLCVLPQGHPAPHSDATTSWL